MLPEGVTQGQAELLRLYRDAVIARQMAETALTGEAASLMALASEVFGQVHSLSQLRALIEDQQGASVPDPALAGLIAALDRFDAIARSMEVLIMAEATALADVHNRGGQMSPQARESLWLMFEKEDTARAN